MERIPSKEKDPRRWRLLVAVDGSEGSAEAVAWTARLASAMPAEVVAVHALPRPAYAGGYGPWMMGMTTNDWRDEWRGWADRVGEKLEREWCRPLREAGVAHRTVLIEGGVPELLSRVRKEDADLLIVGRRGLGGFGELVVGSFSHQLVHHSPIPVLVVPRHETRAGEAGDEARSMAVSNA
jgi:nucleotide-binding universal stress UspA family protein